MIYECVNFNAEEVKKMSKEAFVKMHINILWRDRDEATRRKMLVQAYELMKPTKKSK